MSEVLTAEIRDRFAVADALRLLALSALPGNDKTSAVEAFVERYPRAKAIYGLQKPPSAGDLMQKSIAPATTSDPAFAGKLLPPALLDPLVTRLREATVLAKIPGLVKAPINTPIPSESAAPNLAWTKQGSPKPVSKLSLDSITLLLYKFAGILVLSEELARATADGAAATIFGRMLIQASARFLDTQFLDPTVAAVAAQNPASVTAGVTPVAPGATNDATVAALVSAFFAARPNATLPCFVCSPAVAAAIAGSGNHPGLLTTGGTLVGIPVVTTIGAAGNLILLDGPGVYAFDGGAEIDTSRHAAFETEAAPTDPPTAATVLVDLWSHDLIGIRLDRFCSWAAEPNAVSYAVVA